MKKKVAEKGHNKILVVDARGCRERAVVGDMIAKKAVENGWKGFVVFGCVRDSEELKTIPNLGVFALGTHPRKTKKSNRGTAGDVVSDWAGVDKISPGDFVVADSDGIVVLNKAQRAKL